MTSARTPPLLACFGILLAITATYQWFYCLASTNSDISGLFVRGTQIPEPPELERYGFHYPSSPGYDGQFYRMMAHDPYRTKNYWSYLDDPRLRGGRILIPFAAGVLGGNSIGAVDLWYVSIVDILLALGGVCFVLLTDDRCPRLFAVALYLLIPAVIASTDRMVLDGPSVAGFLAVLLFYAQRRRTPLLIVLILLPLIREVNLAVTAGVALVYLTRRDIRTALRIAATAVPGVAWLAWIATSTPPTSAIVHVSTPLLPQVLRLFTVVQRPLPGWQNTMMQAIDLISIAALLFTFGLLATVLANVGSAKKQKGADSPDGNELLTFDWALIILPSAIALAFIAGPDVLKDPYGYMRIDSLLVAWAVLRLVTNSRGIDYAQRFSFWKRRLFPAVAYISASSIGLLIFRARPIADLFQRL